MTTTGTGGSVADLNAALAAALLAVPGVVRIEPRLMSSLQRLARPGADVVPVSVRIRDGRAELSVDISTDLSAGGSAVEVALAVQALATSVIVDAGLAPGEVDVTVLEVGAV